MFFKQKKQETEKKTEYEVSYENLAVPEVRKEDPDETKTVDVGVTAAEETAADEEETIVYDTVAIPEIHLKKKK